MLRSSKINMQLASDLDTQLARTEKSIGEQLAHTEKYHECSIYRDMLQMFQSCSCKIVSILIADRRPISILSYT
jgi:hypothetical protein